MKKIWWQILLLSSWCRRCRRHHQLSSSAFPSFSLVCHLDLGMLHCSVDSENCHRISFHLFFAFRSFLSFGEAFIAPLTHEAAADNSHSNRILYVHKKLDIFCVSARAPARVFAAKWLGCWASANACPNCKTFRAKYAFEPENVWLFALRTLCHGSRTRYGTTANNAVLCFYFPQFPWYIPFYCRMFSIKLIISI